MKIYVQIYVNTYSESFGRLFSTSQVLLFTISDMLATFPLVNYQVQDCGKISF